MTDECETTLAAIVQDGLAHYPPEDRRRRSPASAVLRVAIASAGFRCTLTYRMENWFRKHLWPIGPFVGRLLFWFSRHWYGCSISGNATIGGGLILPHPQNIVIGPSVRIGQRAWIFHNVTIGGAPGRAGMPVIGDDARIYTGAVLSGPIRVGERVTIGANAVATHDVPSGAMVRPLQARVEPLPGAGKELA